MMNVSESNVDCILLLFITSLHSLLSALFVLHSLLPFPSLPHFLLSYLLLLLFILLPDHACVDRVEITLCPLSFVLPGRDTHTHSLSLSLSLFLFEYLYMMFNYECLIFLCMDYFFVCLFTLSFIVLFVTYYVLVPNLRMYLLSLKCLTSCLKALLSS